MSSKVHDVSCVAEENLELERRMAATLGSDEDITVNVQADYRV